MPFKSRIFYFWEKQTSFPYLNNKVLLSVALVWSSELQKIITDSEITMCFQDNVMNSKALLKSR